MIEPSPILHSFDVFDTLITRPFSRPTDLFRLVAADVLPERASERELDDFVQARIFAEARARDAEPNRDDITLDMIYRQFELSDRFGRHAEVAKARELAHELSSVVPIRSGIEHVSGLLNAGERVVFLSDMYLPATVIADMLRRAGLAVDAGTLYVSGEIGLSKHHGRLFDYVAAREAVPPDRCLHRGDNWHPDVLRPRQRGWRAMRFSESELNRFEDPVGRPAPWTATRAGGLSRAVRLRRVSGSAEAAMLVSGVIGPFLTAFVAHVLQDAQARGIDTLFFVSRDGQVFLKIATALQAAGFAPGITCRYLYGSRQAWFLPSVTEATRDRIAWAFVDGMSSAPDDILRRLEIDPSEVALMLQELGIDERRLHTRQSARELDTFIEALLSPPVADLLTRRAGERRASLMSYLGAQGLFDPKRNYALVDVGWTLKSQLALRRCLQAEGRPFDVSGYYLGVVLGHEPLAQAGPASAFVGFPGDDVPCCLHANWFFRLSTVLLVEHLFTLADHPSLARYAEQGGALSLVFKRDYRSEALILFTAQLHEELESYAGFAGTMFGSELVTPEFREWALENVRRFACEPRAEEVNAVAWLPTNREQSHDKRHEARLASQLTLRDVWDMVIYDLFPSREGHFSPDFAWNAGAAAISPPIPRFAYYALRSIMGVLGRLRGMYRRD